MWNSEQKQVLLQEFVDALSESYSENDTDMYPDVETVFNVALSASDPENETGTYLGRQNVSTPADLGASALTEVGEPSTVKNVNRALTAMRKNINSQLQGSLKSHDPLEMDLHQGQAEMDKLFGLSSIGITTLSTQGFRPPLVSINFGAKIGHLKLTGVASAKGHRVRFNVIVGASINTPISASMDESTGTIKHFDVSGVHVNFYKMRVHVKVPIIGGIIAGKINRMLNEKKDEFAARISAKVQRSLDGVLNGPAKRGVNQKLQQFGR